MAACVASPGPGGRRVSARDVRPDLGGRQSYLRRAAAGEGEWRRAADRRPRPAAGVAEADPGPPAGAARAGHGLPEPHRERAQGRAAVPGSARTFDQPQTSRAARRGVPATARLQGADAGPNVGDVVPDLRARTRAADHSVRPRGAGNDPDPVRWATVARQPSPRPAGAQGRGGSTPLRRTSPLALAQRGSTDADGAPRRADRFSRRQRPTRPARGHLRPFGERPLMREIARAAYRAGARIVEPTYVDRHF